MGIGDWGLGTSTGVITLDDINRISRSNNYRSVSTLEINGNNNGSVLRTAVTNVGNISFDSSTNTLTVTLDPDALDNNTITIEYDAELNENADLAAPGNHTNTRLVYSNSPYGTGTSTRNSQTTVYTYGIKVFKQDDEGSPLSGAQIRLCRDTACTNVVDTKTTESDGYATFTGIAEDSYYVQELSAPSGFRVDTALKTVTIDNTNDYTTYNFTNYPLGVLPSTGGAGIYIYTGIGLVIIGGAVALLIIFVKKRKKDEK